MPSAAAPHSTASIWRTVGVRTGRNFPSPALAMPDHLDRSIPGFQEPRRDQDHSTQTLSPGEAGLPREPWALVALSRRTPSPLPHDHRSRSPLTLSILPNLLQFST